MSVVDEGTVSYIKEYWQFMNIKSPVVVSAMGHKFHMRGVAQIQLQIGQDMVLHPLIVIKGLKMKAIIGDDFLRKLRAVIDYKKRQLILNAKDTEAEAAAFIRKAVQIMPHSARRVKVTISGKPACQTGLIEPLDAWQVAEALTDTNPHGNTEVLMINAMDTAVDLDRGERITHFTYLHSNDIAPLD